MPIKISSLYIYPIKSTAALELKECEVVKTGLTFDRKFAIIDNEGNVLTGREQPEITLLKTSLHYDYLRLATSQNVGVDISLHYPKKDPFPIKLFGDNYMAQNVSAEADQWLSSHFNRPCQLVSLHPEHQRPIKTKYGGRENDIIEIVDAAPILVISEASINLLNEKLNHNISVLQFRPNIVVTGCKAHDEDNWQQITVGNIQLDAAATCKRCNFSTVNPTTAQRDPNGEPLKTLSTYRKTDSGYVAFGAYFIPRGLGYMRAGDELYVL